MKKNEKRECTEKSFTDSMQTIHNSKEREVTTYVCQACIGKCETYSLEAREGVVGEVERRARKVSLCISLSFSLSIRLCHPVSESLLVNWFA